ncbi:MAG: rRNA maturation RNase YbeY [Thermogutta sp.]
MYRIAIRNQARSCSIDRPLARRAIRMILKRAGVETAEISVAIVSDAMIAQLHEQFLGDGDPTDVLSFLLEKEDRHLEGEIVVSAETAARWAKCIGWTPENELLLYIVHGTLHLVGYDDQTPAERRKMRLMERAAFAELGRAIPPRKRR